MSYSDIYDHSISNREDFWAEQANELKWSKPPQTICTPQNGHHKWFADGMINMSELCLDRHVLEGRGMQNAIIYDSPFTGQVEHITYKSLLDQVSKFAAGLRNLGVGEGTTVIIYMPMIPQAIVAMLACARIGAIHSVVFGGFAPHELAMRIDDAKPKVIISASFGIEFDKKIPYKILVDAAIKEAKHKPEYQVYYRREEGFDSLAGKGELDYNALMRCGTVDARPYPSTHPLYILYTSGTTGTPKGIIRDTGGYATALNFTMKNFYNVRPGDVFWAASDIGWVVGHSYIVYAPLLYGCTTILYEGKPVRTPDAGAFWRVIEDHKVNVLFTAPTAIRAIKKEDPDGRLLKKYDLSTLRQLFLAGERCDPATYEWISALLQRPVIDHWWQTESGWPMLGIMTGIEGTVPKAGAAGKPVCGYDVRILTEEGAEAAVGQEGYVVVKLPLPPGCLTTLWKNEIRYIKGYLEHFPGYYLTGDSGFKDGDGYFYIMGRVDDVINVSGHRLSTGEMEELVSGHPAVAECAVMGIADELRGQRPVALVVLKDGQTTSNDDIEVALVQLIREKIGAVAYFRNAAVVKRLPKTRSGKILRKTIRNIADGTRFTMPSTIEDPTVLEEIKQVMRTRKLGNAFI
ncbi:propionyl-CoA synthetase [Flavipsychrobacter stenotrophus]|uniref:Propionyl-CoA synthetase n=1 Tax=Flavipsychrobacter stenotrophus TaxID=2077091 RepID=A0A2S7SV11_9BACT|nr:AMP-binding protein [Flavipsychrobacter stenotrophus]PQJ10467.1 propionyl-CoA synthetase [Flavipsychrobacter stenotrophus]